MKAQNALNHLIGLNRVAFNQRKAFLERMLFLDLRLKRFAEREDAGHNVAEIVRETHRDDGERFLPGGARETLFRNGLPRHIQPNAFVTEQKAVAAVERLAMFEYIGDASRQRVADSIRGDLPTVRRRERAILLL